MGSTLLWFSSEDLERNIAEVWRTRLAPFSLLCSKNIRIWWSKLDSHQSLALRNEDGCKYTKYFVFTHDFLRESLTVNLTYHEKYFKTNYWLKAWSTPLHQEKNKFNSIQSSEYLSNTYCVPSMMLGPEISKINKTRYAHCPGWDYVQNRGRDEHIHTWFYPVLV